MPELRASRPESQQPYLRHFVFQPGPSERNRTVYYALSFGVFVVVALALEAVVDSGLGALALDNRALARALEAVRERTDHVPWRWFFLFFAISYGVIWVALGAAVKLVHGRPILSLYTDRARFDLKRAFSGFLLYTAIMVAPFAIFAAFGHSGLKPHFQPGPFFELLALSCMLLLVQTSTEEALFRGYLTQFIATVTDSRAILVFLPSLLFMFAHFGNPEVLRQPQILFFYFGFGVFTSLIVLRERGLELAIGAHFSNNLVNSVFARGDDSIFQTPAIFVLPTSVEATPLAVAFTGSFTPVIYWFLTAMLLRRR